MYASECRTFSDEATGCAAHGHAECLCDVQPLEGGVPIRAVANVVRLLQLGVDRLAFVTWAEEITTAYDGRALQLVAEA